MPKAQKSSSRPTPRHNPLGNRDTNARQTAADKSSNSDPKSKQASVASKTAGTSSTDAPASTDTDNYLILIQMTDTSEPNINRLLSVPPTLTFKRMHHVLQAAFGWANSHMHSFDVVEVGDEDGHWLSRKSLLQISSDPDLMSDNLESIDEANITLQDAYEKPEWKGKAKITYEYDHGDSWEHELALLGRADPRMNAQVHAPDFAKVLCLAGEGHACAEDAGGPGGWEDLKECFAKPRKQDDGRKQWYKIDCLNGDPKGLKPYEFSVLDVNDALQEAGLIQG